MRIVAAGVCTALLQRFLRYSPQKGGVKVLHSESYCFWWCAVWLVSALGICVLWWWSQLFSLVDLLQKDAFTSEFDRRSSYFVRTDGVLIAVVLAERFDAEWCICIRILAQAAVVLVEASGHAAYRYCILEIVTFDVTIFTSISTILRGFLSWENLFWNCLRPTVVQGFCVDRSM